jgi:hypothetical protein
MSQTDWVGGETPETRAMKPARDTRDSVADQKARLHLRLHRLCQYCPDKIRNGDVFKTREWVSRQSSAKKVAGKSRASANELQMAVTSLEGYLSHAEMERFA